MNKAIRLAALCLAAFLALPAVASAKKLDDTELLARIVYLEAHGESDAGQRAVAQVVLNRVEMGYWGDTVKKAIYAPGQFTTADRVSDIKPTEKEYANVAGVLGAETPVLPPWEMYFQRAPRKKRGYINYVVIGEHHFGGYEKDRQAWESEAMDDEKVG